MVINISDFWGTQKCLDTLIPFLKCFYETCNITKIKLSQEYTDPNTKTYINIYEKGNEKIPRYKYEQEVNCGDNISTILNNVFEFIKLTYLTEKQL